MHSEVWRGHRNPQVLFLTAASLSAALVAGCSSSSSKASSTPTTLPATTVPTTTLPATTATTAPAGPSASASATPMTRALTVLVMNDDGVKAPGIDALVKALQKEPGLTLKVVGPATNQSGKGGSVSPGAPSYSNTTMLSGYPAVAVAGTPADSANVAFDKLGIKPDVAISGVNAGQNLGPVVDFSGTVGAARVAARHGVPALAVSSGFATKIDFAIGAEYAIRWLRAERAKLPLASTSAPATVTGINVPTCTTGSIRGELAVALQTTLVAPESALGASNCASTANPKTEIAAFSDGFVTEMPIPLNPSS